ncbi:Glycosyltransferase family 61 protein [Rhynchospora pubera]|uniref:Glycosyltransferase family 61 protein n=1 Tax=Rhynchospora pubera TaxID=906938 RepID=A0AAV8D8W1_9POAL|nr:Glycosyltransferase family 61 protein [Rhynchospora pubera]
MGEIKAMKSLKNIYHKYIGVGFFLGFFLVLLTYFTVSEQFAIRAPNAVSQSLPNSEVEATSSVNHLAEHDNQSSSNLEHVTENVEPDVVSALKKSTPSTNQEQQEDVSNFKPFVDANEGPKVSDSSPSINKEEENRVDQDSKPFETRNQVSHAKVICDTQTPNSDTCDIDGDVRTHGVSSSILLVPEGFSESHEWKIRPYSRKHMMSIKDVTVRQLDSPEQAPICTVKENIPALVLALGGLIGNYWHDHTDVLIPLYLASRKFNGEVQFLVTNIQRWYIGKYMKVFKELSHYEIIDFDKDDQVRCYPHVHVGIRIQKEFSIVPSLSPEGYSMVNFTKFMRSIYGLPRDAPISLRENPSAKPRLMIISRRHPRKIVNLQDIIQLGERLGFEVIIGDPPFNVNVGEFAKEVNTVDVMMGVHGAGLTNCIYLPTNAVLIQIVPYGNLEKLCKTDFGDPAVDMKLKYIDYHVTAEESTLLEMLGKDHPAVKDPAAIHQSGWDKIAEFYLGKQDVRIDVNRFAPVLSKAMEFLRE